MLKHHTYEYATTHNIFDSYYTLIFCPLFKLIYIFFQKYGIIRYFFPSICVETLFWGL